MLVLGASAFSPFSKTAMIHKFISARSTLDSQHIYKITVLMLKVVKYFDVNVEKGERENAIFM
jgi:hypothetical protein